MSVRKKRNEYSSVQLFLHDGLSGEDFSKQNVSSLKLQINFDQCGLQKAH